MKTHAPLKYTVLIVDDVPENIQVMSDLLYQQGINITIAQSGREALTFVSRKPPDVILLDIIMPEMDGFEVCRRLKQQPEARDIPIIFITAKTETEDIVRGFELGAVDYITKPFHPKEVLSRVCTHLALKRSQDLIATQNQQLLEQNRQLQELYSMKEQYFSTALRDREKQIHQQNEFLKTMLESLTHPFYVIDVRDYTITVANSAALKLGSLSETATCYALSHNRDFPCDGLEHSCPMKTVKETKQAVMVEHTHYDSEGNPKNVEIHAYPIFDNERNVVQMIEYSLDVTERRSAERALRTSEQQYRFLAERAADGIGIIQEGKLVFVNEALASMFGYTMSQLVGKAPGELFLNPSEGDLGKKDERFPQRHLDPQSWPVLQHVITGDGREIWTEARQNTIQWRGQPAILMTVRDITKRKLREIAIEEERNILRRENIQLKQTIKDRYRFGEIIGKSPAIQVVYDLIMKAAASENAVLICGESGTGKELIAQTIHQLSTRQKGAFVTVNCGAIPETLFEREFFGHRKGAFTGADRDAPGFFGAAHQGSLFLDEVGELSLSMQVKLLRAIESGEYTPLGDNSPRTANARIIAAANRNLTEAVERGLMREDFFYRIHVIVIAVPPLRDRKEDIPLLVDYFLQRFSEDKTPPTLPGKVLESLYNHNWPGNIRQLQNTLSRYLTMGSLDFTAPRSAELNELSNIADINQAQPELTFNEAVERFEKQILLKTLEQQHWHRTNTAAKLGLQRKSLFRKMKKYGLL